MNQIRIALFWIGKVISFVLPLRFWSKFRPILNFIYTGLISRSFKHFGNRSAFKYKLSYLIGPQYIYIGNNTTIGKNVELTAWDKYNAYNSIQTFNPEIVIGNGTCIRDYSHITAINSIKIGNGVLTGLGVLITDNAHGTSTPNLADIPPSLRPLHSNGAVVIEDNVWIGSYAMIMPGVTIGKGSIIAAGSVVTHNVPEYSVAAGVPATVIKTLKQQT